MMEITFYSLLLMLPIVVAVIFYYIIQKIKILRNNEIYLTQGILSLNLIMIYTFVFPQNYLYGGFSFLALLFGSLIIFLIGKPLFNEILIKQKIIKEKEYTNDEEKIEKKYNMITLFYLTLILTSISHIFYYTGILSFKDLPNIYEIIYNGFLFFPLYLTIIFLGKDIFDFSILSKKHMLISTNIFIFLTIIGNILLDNVITIYFPSLFNIPLFIIGIILLILNLFYSIIISIKENMKERLIFFTLNIVMIMILYLV